MDPLIIKQPQSLGSRDVQPPLSPFELALGHVAGRAPPGLLVRLAPSLALRAFVPGGSHPALSRLYHGVPPALVRARVGGVGRRPGLTHPVRVVRLRGQGQGRKGWQGQVRQRRLG